MTKKRVGLTPRHIIWAVLALVATVGLAFTLYQRSAVLEPSGKRYLSDLSAAVTSLHKSSVTLASKSDAIFYDRPPETLEAKLLALQSLESDTKRLQAQVVSFRKTADAIPHSSYDFLSPVYQKAETAREQGDATADQIDEVLAEYLRFLAFFKTYYPIRDYINSEFDQFNGLTNLDVLTGQQGGYYVVAQHLNSDADHLSTSTIPRGFEDLTSRAVALNKKAANGFTMLADAYSPPVDAAIYSAAVNLESLTAENEALNNEVLDATMQNSPTLKSIGDVPETMDRFKF